MIELANEGYIKINEFKTDSRFSRKSQFVIEYIKPYSGNDEYKRLFFNGLFKNGRTRVYKKDLENKFYTTINSIQTRINSSENKKKVFDSKSLNLVVLGWIISVLSGAAAVLINMNTIGGSEKNIATAIGIAVAIISLVFSCFIRRRTETARNGKNRQKLKIIANKK